MKNNLEKKKKIVCLGGGIGTANLIRGLKEYPFDISVIVSMADDGGSAGRLRRLYNIPPPGDLINCIFAMSDADPLLKDLLLYRFAGNRYGRDDAIQGQKFGNLMFVALMNMTGDFHKALLELQSMFRTAGKIYPATEDGITIWAKTSTGHVVKREENIDRGRFKGKIEELHLLPKNPVVGKGVIESLAHADVIIAGPGDLYTTILPVLLVPGILRSVVNSSARKLFVVNVANKLHETPSYTIETFANAVKKHCGNMLFDTFIINNNTAPLIPKKFTQQYSYVPLPNGHHKASYRIHQYDLVDESFPLYHNPAKLANAVVKHI